MVFSEVTFTASITFHASLTSVVSALLSLSSLTYITFASLTPHIKALDLQTFSSLSYTQSRGYYKLPRQHGLYQS